jgi:hypothetical protein
MVLLVLTRYGSNELLKTLDKDSPPYFNRPRCSQNTSTSMTSSNDIMEKCFQFPPSYKKSSPVSNKTNIIFHPMTNDTDQLVQHAQRRLEKMDCTNIKIK